MCGRWLASSKAGSPLANPWRAASLVTKMTPVFGTVRNPGIVIGIGLARRAELGKSRPTTR